MIVSALIEALKELEPSEDIEILIDDMDEDDPIEEGDFLTIQPGEVGDYVRGKRVIRAKKT